MLYHNWWNVLNHIYRASSRPGPTFKAHLLTRKVCHRCGHALCVTAPCGPLSVSISRPVSRTKIIVPVSGLFIGRAGPASWWDWYHALKKKWHSISRLATSAKCQLCRHFRIPVAPVTGTWRAFCPRLESIQSHCVPCSWWPTASPGGQTEHSLKHCWGTRRLYQAQCKLGMPHGVSLPTLGPCCKQAAPVIVEHSTRSARSETQSSMCPCFSMQTHNSAMLPQVPVVQQWMFVWDDAVNDMQLVGPSGFHLENPRNGHHRLQVILWASVWMHVILLWLCRWNLDFLNNVEFVAKTLPVDTKIANEQCNKYLSLVPTTSEYSLPQSLEIKQLVKHERCLQGLLTQHQ